MSLCQGLFNALLLVVAVLGGPGFLLLLLGRCYRRHGLSAGDVVFHFLPGLESVWSRAQHLVTRAREVADSAQQEVKSWQSSEGRQIHYINIVFLCCFSYYYQL